MVYILRQSPSMAKDKARSLVLPVFGLFVSSRCSLLTATILPLSAQSVSRGTSLQLVELHPVYLHLYGQLLGVGLAYPRALNLHVYEQVIGRAEWELALVGGLYSGVDQRCLAIDRQDDGVGQYLYGIGVEAVAVYGQGRAVGRILVFLEHVGVVSVYGLIGDGVVVEMLHDVYFSTFGPFYLCVGQHPYCGPCSLCAAKLCAHLYLAVPDGALVLGLESAGDIAGVVGVAMGVDGATQHQSAVTHGVERVGVRHVAFPVGIATWNLGPREVVIGVSVKMVLPYEPVLVWR